MRSLTGDRVVIIGEEVDIGEDDTVRIGGDKLLELVHFEREATNGKDCTIE